MSGTLSISALGRDEASAVTLEKTLNNSIDTGRMMATAELRKSIEGGGPVNEATNKCLDRVGGVRAVESSREATVPWTQPADLEFDLSNLLAKTGDVHQGGFHVLMARSFF